MKSIRPFSFLLSLLLILFGACKKEQPGLSQQDVFEAQVESPEAEVIRFTPDIRSIGQANNEFALELYAKLRSKKGNLFFSPHSIFTALAMVFAGARGQTESQMVVALHLPVAADSNKKDSSTVAIDRQEFASVCGTMMNGLNKKRLGGSHELGIADALRGQRGHRFREEFLEFIRTNYDGQLNEVDFNAAASAWMQERTNNSGSYELSIANALWGQKGDGFCEEFLEIIRTNYDGQFNEVDFITDAKTACKTINAWVEEKTNNRIKNLVGRDALNEMTRLVLTNAIYFKGNWEKPFKPFVTMDTPFTLASGRRIEVPMMRQTDRFAFMESKEFQALELPYMNNRLSMIILLPKKFNGLRRLERTLTPNNLSRWLGQLNSSRVIVSVPKFQMTSQFDLGSALESMGMRDAFSPTDADFSGINGKRDLYISAVIHKAYVDANEEGTEAAAATATAVTILFAGGEPVQMPVFLADHPFLFLIRENTFGTILFIGRVLNPNM